MTQRAMLLLEGVVEMPIKLQVVGGDIELGGIEGKVRIRHKTYLQAPSFIKSSSLPGVATTMLTPLRSC